MPETEDDQTQTDPNLAHLRKQADERNEFMTRAETAERKLAIIEALPGVDVSKGHGKLFLKAYDGPTDDPEAIRKAAQEYDVMAPAAAATPDATDETLAAHEAVEDASAGAEPAAAKDKARQLLEDTDPSKGLSRDEFFERLGREGMVV